MRTTDGPVHHRVEITDIPTWFRATPGFDPTQGIADEEAFAGRCGEVGDELGSFTHTPRGAHPTPILTAALTAPDCRPRETHLSTAYETLAGLHNQLGLTDPLDPTTRPYHFRPFRVLPADRFAEALPARATALEDARKPRSEES
ncbi:hypothetical protein [Streptomyces griseorubiginosus]|uniref:hypothetical protein n=1 Tax=Streptomyces griseorubiginosus TaxID=67304 RepID=UPI003658B75D